MFFGTDKLIRNAIKSEFIYFARNVVLFCVDNNSPHHNQSNNFLVLGEGPTDGVNDSTGAAVKKFSINFSKTNKTLWLTLKSLRVEVMGVSLITPPVIFPKMCFLERG